MLYFSGKGCSEFPKKVLILIGILNQIRRLRKKACTIPDPVASSFSGKQEVVQLSFEEPVTCPPDNPSGQVIPSDTAIKITYHGFQIEITNAAHRETISNILSVLHCLC